MAVDYSRFPARVLFSDGRLLKKAAVVVAAGKVQVAEQTPSTKLVDVVYEGRLQEQSRNPDRTQQLVMTDGLTLRIGKGDGCSCRSPLKAWFSEALRRAA